jgi:hypothetical protein
MSAWRIVVLGSYIPDHYDRSKKILMSPPLILSHSTVPASTLGFDVSANTTHLHILTRCPT